MAQAGAIPRDPIKESISLELDMINILYVLLSFVRRTQAYYVLYSIRLVQILAMRQNRNK